jgi:AraC family transcriptional regulator of adaptative response / DNA-3-methyladenine glycosylase II
MDLNPEACYRAVRARDARFDGRLFTGVSTTGIYCRPICPARTPKREHMRFFATAAAAQEAGFRPCLRCRPETAPELAAWRGTSNTVSRALALIESGALDDAGVDALAERLGLGGRQLRRLFLQHVGASPVAVAQTRRVLLALQLLRETQLPINEVAAAAGFSSIRRFNEMFRRLYGRPPGSLRRDDRLGARTSSSEVEIRLRYRPPYDWRSVLSFLRTRAIRGVEAVSAEGYVRTIEVGGVHGIVEVAAAPGDALRATVAFPRLAMLPAIIARLRRVFDLAADPLAIGAALSEDPRLAALVRVRPGLRVPGSWDGFELAVRAVLGQQITVKAAAHLAARLVSAYGEPVRVEGGRGGGLTHAFPRPERLAAADLASLGMPARRAQTLTALASTFASDPDLLSPQREPAASLARLRAIPGIGEWTAQYIAMRALREPDAFPADDVALRRALGDGSASRPSPRDLIAQAERWRPWRAYAAQHLWTALASRDGGLEIGPAATA